MGDRERAAALADIDALITLIEADQDMADEPDDASVGWYGDKSEMPTTFGHIRRARRAVTSLRALTVQDAAAPGQTTEVRDVVGLTIAAYAKIRETAFGDFHIANLTTVSLAVISALAAAGYRITRDAPAIAAIERIDRASAKEATHADPT